MFNHQSSQPFEQIFPNAIKSELRFVQYVLAYDRPRTVQEVKEVESISSN